MLCLITCIHTCYDEERAIKCSQFVDSLFIDWHFVDKFLHQLLKANHMHGSLEESEVYYHPLQV